MALTQDNKNNAYARVCIKKEPRFEEEEESLTTQLDFKDVNFTGKTFKAERRSIDGDSRFTPQWLAVTAPSLTPLDESKTLQLQDIRGIVVSSPDAMFDTEKLSSSVEKFIKQELNTEEQETTMFLFVDCSTKDPLALDEDVSDHSTLAETEKFEPVAESNEGTYSDKPLQCTQCSVRFHFFADLDAHMSIHDPEKSYPCRFCPTVLPSVGALSKHEGAHPENNLRKCHLCSSVFNKDQLDAHMLVHVGEKYFACQFCPNKYLTNWQLNRHLKSHSLTKCLSVGHNSEPSLGDSFSRFGSLSDHNKSDAPVRKPEKLYFCCFCQTELHGAPAVSQHEALVHPGKKLKPCLHCSATFPCNRELKAHMVVIHASERPFACPLCPNRYPTRGELNRHSRSHSDERPYSCSFCSRSFRQPGSLKDHLLQHTGVKRFCCAHCPAKFYKKKNLELHAGIHSYKDLSKEQLEHDISAKPHYCPNCFARFSCTNSKRRHMRKGSCNKPQSIRNVRPLPSSEIQS